MGAKEKKEMDAAIEEDPLIQALIDAKGKQIEIIAFGICYTGRLEAIDVDNGTVVVADDDNSAMLEIERIESLSLLSPS